MARDLDPITDADGLAEVEFLPEGLTLAWRCGVGEVGHFVLGGEKGLGLWGWECVCSFVERGKMGKDVRKWERDRKPDFISFDCWVFGSQDDDLYVT